MATRRPGTTRECRPHPPLRCCSSRTRPFAAVCALEASELEAPPVCENQARPGSPFYTLSQIDKMDFENGDNYYIAT